jgi:hypothetical protein
MPTEIKKKDEKFVIKFKIINSHLPGTATLSPTNQEIKLSKTNLNRSKWKYFQIMAFMC